MLRMVAAHNGSWLDWKAFNRVYEKDCSSWTTSTQSTAERYRIEHGFSLGINEDAHAKLKLCIAIIFRSRIYIITIFAFFFVNQFFAIQFATCHRQLLQLSRACVSFDEISLYEPEAFSLFICRRESNIVVSWKWWKCCILMGNR